MNNNEPETTAASARPLARSAAAGLACLLAASWVAPASANVVTEFNAIALACLSRPGPGSVMDLALVQVAVHDAIQAIEQRYETYRPTPPGTGSKAAAAAAAAYRMLSDNRICAPPAAPAVDPQGALDALFKPYLNAQRRRPRRRLRGRGPHARSRFAARRRRSRCRSSAAPASANGGRRRPGNAPMSFRLPRHDDAVRHVEPVAIPPGPAAGRDERAVHEGLQRGEGEGLDARRIRRRARARHRPTPTWRGSGPATSARNGTRSRATSRSTGSSGIGDTARLLALANLAAADAAHRRMGQQGPLQLLAADHGDPQRRRRRQPQRRPATPTWMPFIAGAHFPTTGASQTPPYPDYVSGANGLTGAFTAMLQLFFHTDIVPFAIYKAVAGERRDLHEPAAVSPDLGCGRGSRRRAHPARHPLPFRRHGGADARHARCVACVHERAAAEASRLARLRLARRLTAK